MLIAAWIIALFFAANIGASGTAASMGAAFGAGAVRKRSVALGLVAVAAFLGAVLGGGSVVKTLSGGIVPAHDITSEVTVMILACACATLFLSNLIGVPLSTSEVTVGSVVGVGIAFGHVFVGKVAVIVAVWLVMPFVAMAIAYLLGRFIRPVEQKIHRPTKMVAGFFIALLIAGGCYEAFTAGMNNVANAIGPLVAAGVVSAHTGLYWGAAFVAIGALTLGGKVLETNAKKITQLSVLQGTVVSVTSATLVLVASLFGLPVPQTQATTMAIFGVGQSKVGRDIWRQDVVKRIIGIWIASPLSSLVLSYSIVAFVIEHNVIPLVVDAAAAMMGFVVWRLKTPRGAAEVAAADEERA